MKRLVVRTAWVLLLVALAGMTGRLAWRASQTRTGPELVRAQWGDSTVGLVAGRRTPVISRPPVDQAAFWLGEADRVLSAQPDCAELSAGAAVVLDRPMWGFTCRKIRGSMTSERERRGRSRHRLVLFGRLGRPGLCRELVLVRLFA
jgi:hypothetical protein